MIARFLWENIWINTSYFAFLCKTGRASQAVVLHEANIILFPSIGRFQYYIEHFLWNCPVVNATRPHHDDVTQWEHFPRYWHFVRGTTGHRWIPSQRPVTRSFGAFFDLRLNKLLSKQSWRRWSETPSRSLWRHCNAYISLDQVMVENICILIRISQKFVRRSTAIGGNAGTWIFMKCPWLGHTF